jgi:hypothetical protein
MNVQTIAMIQDVRVAIDMNRRDNQLIKVADEETLLTDALIESKLTDAIRLTELECPVTMLESGFKFADYTHDIDKNGKVTVQLPDDFMRLVAFEMSDWSRGVYEAIEETDPEYSRLQSPWPGVAGSPQRPAVAIVTKSTGRVLEGYSSDSSATIEYAIYRPYPVIDEDGYLEVSKHCYRPAVYRAAALVLATLGESEAQSMMEIYKSMLV